MPAYVVDYSTVARKQLGKLDPQVRRRLVAASEALGMNPRPPGFKPLVGRAGYRIRVGDWRVIYEIEEGQLLVLVLELGHRRDIYDR